MKRLLALLLVVALSYPLIAQHNRCATMEYHYKQIQDDPEYAQRLSNIEKEITRAVNNYGFKNSSPTVTIPVVFHILYNVNNSSQNISTARIYEQINVLNDDFSASNSDISNVPAAFQSLIYQKPAFCNRLEFYVYTSVFCLGDRSCITNLSCQPKNQYALKLPKASSYIQVIFFNMA